MKYFRYRPTPRPAVKVTGPFGLDMELLQKIELNAPAKCRCPKLLETGFSDTEESPVSNVIKVPVAQ